MPSQSTRRSDRIREIVNDVIVRRSVGENPHDESLLAAHPELMPELADQLRYLQVVECAEEEADITAQLDFLQVTPPERISRYCIQSVLGKGGFGVVYLAHDEQLDRQVAVKVPHASVVHRLGDADAYLAEARMVASLDHPNIVPVHDVGSTDDFPCFVVSKYVEGTDLAKRIREYRLPHTESVQIIATVADALHYAHTQGLVHRDVKPGNILLGGDDKAYVVDFGLALREENVGKGPKYAGTPAYMSPEQARGEGHRVDGRSDIFSLGVVLYEMLAARKPFRAGTQVELLEQIVGYEPRPLRQYDERLSKELERICYKALAKRASERYSTAHDMADDLRHFLAQQTAEISSGLSTAAVVSCETKGTDSTPAGAAATPFETLGSSSSSRTLKIVPKGLRSFDAHDADFFLELLPGPRDRDGLPDSLAFWKTHIEETDPKETFSVGLVYGPSGCGKSSLVKAGLLPRLSDDVLPVYIEATPDQTESRLLRGLRKRCPLLEDGLNLVETLADLRRRQGIAADKKVLIVIDQFEQWLHNQQESLNAELVQALRQCDGGRVQCVVMVRDDFWMAATRFMHELDVPFLQGRNSAAVDLFPTHHAKRVLAAFGRAFGSLPEMLNELSSDQEAFLHESVASLADEGKVISVRLALFAEMMKGKPWTTRTLRDVGGAEGVGAAFLEETFSASSAPPEHRLHQQAARAILRALLPDTGTEIKGQMKSYDDLLETAGYTRRPKDFDNVVKMLDDELRLITPTELVASGEGTEERAKRSPGNDPRVSHPVHTARHPPSPPAARYFQLTHDYLVPALQEWLTLKQKETRRGRAELRLAERSALWNAKPADRHLPSWWESLSVRLLTNRRKWTESQRKMMRRAAWVHGVRTNLALLALVLLAVAGRSMRAAILEPQASARAENLVGSLPNIEITQLPAVIENLKEVRRWADPLLKKQIVEATDGKLQMSLALLPVDPGQVDYLSSQLSTCDREQFSVVRDALVPHRDEIVGDLWATVQDNDEPETERFKVAAALAEYSPADRRWTSINSFVAEHLTNAVSSRDFGSWLKHLRPAGHQLADSLTRIHANRDNSSSQREAAAQAIVDYLQAEPDRLIDAILVADEFVEHELLLASLRRHDDVAISRLTDAMQTSLPTTLAKTNEELSDEEQLRRDSHWKRQSIAAVTLVLLGHADAVWALLEFAADPSLRSYVIYHMGKLRVSHLTLADRLETETSISARRALIQCLGQLEVAASERGPLTDYLLNLYTTDPDPGINASASWALRQWQVPLPNLPVGESELTAEQQQQLVEITAEVSDIRNRLAATGDGAQVEAHQRLKYQLAAARQVLSERQTRGIRRWYINSEGQTMVVIPQPAKDVEGVHHSFAISGHELTVAEYRRFRGEADFPNDRNIARTEDSPVHRTKFYQAADYCNWLSERDGIAEGQWVYEPNDQGFYAEGMTIKENFLELQGYRIPTEAEWEYACRAGTTSSYCFGEPLDLLERYGQYVANSEFHTHPVGSLLPNEFGIFDMHGNLWEWTQDPVSGDISPVHEHVQRVSRGGAFVVRPEEASSTSRSPMDPADWTWYVHGFRPARTYRWK